MVDNTDNNDKFTVTYIVGREGDEIIENAKFSESIFCEQYKKALTLINDYLSLSFENGEKIVAFCGERGTGKSSCMRTVLNILQKKDDKKDDKEYKETIQDFLHNIKTEQLIKSKVEVLPIIDPAFFDTEHNVLELVLGQLYINFKEYGKNGEASDYSTKNNILELFETAKRCIDNLHKNADTGDYLEDIDEISAGIQLRDSFKDLVEKYLKYIGKEILVVSIDDIDLNMTHAYKMCEHIRKYLSFQKCIVLVAVNLDQLYDVIELAIRSEIKKSDESFIMDIREMAEKYVEKLIPTSRQINMPKLYDLCDRKLIIKETDGKEIISENRVKEYVVKLIFRKTRYLFYNSKGGVSPIVPNNLRSFVHLLGLLYPMKDISGDKDENKEQNQEIFKQFFYYSWTRLLNIDDRKRVSQLVDEVQDTAINKKAVACLEKLVKDYVAKDDDDADKKEVSAICEKSNIGYNVSVGDVFYLINILEQDALDDKSANLLFFIKSFYSIKLYEAYDRVTEREEELYPEDKEDNGIYRVDQRFNHTNTLQRIIGNGYFNLMPGEILQKEQGTNRTFDIRVVNGKELNDLFKTLSDKIKAGKELDESEFNLAEFFILTIVGCVPQKEINNIENYLRKVRSNLEPYYLQPYNANQGYYIFNALAVFTNLSNPQYTYEKYKQCPGLYDYAKRRNFSLLERHDFSLLDKMAERVTGSSAQSLEEKIHRLQSNAIIRNGEILAAIFENIKSQRDESKKGGDIKKIATLYGNIAKTGMKVYDKDEKVKFESEFYFLKALQDFIDKIVKDTKLKGKFKAIFSVDDGIKKTKKSKNAEKS